MQEVNLSVDIRTEAIGSIVAALDDVDRDFGKDEARLARHLQPTTPRLQR
jgi:hypothetical protein